MRKYLLLLAICASPLLANAQKSSGDKQRAWLMYQSDSLLQAKDLIDKVTAQSPGSTQPDAWYYKGMIYNSINLNEMYHTDYPEIDLQTFEAMKTCLALDKRKEYSETIRGDIYQLAIGFVNKGVEHYDEGLNNDSKNDLKKAAFYFDKFAEAFEQLDGRKFTLLKVLKENQLDDNTIAFFSAIAKDKLGETEKAEQEYSKLVTKKYNDPQLYLQLRNLYMKRGQKDKALQVIAAGRDRLPDMPELSMIYAEMLADAGRHQEALDVVKKAQKGNKNNPLLFTTSAVIYEKMQDYKTAEAQLELALKADEDDLNVNLSAGNYYMRKATRPATSKDEARKLHQAAQPYLEKAGRLEPRNRQALESLLELYTKLENTKKAEQIQARLDRL
jgi:tetratricopeptide (TPR) repeat protein